MWTALHKRVFDLWFSLPTNCKIKICSHLNSAETQLELELLPCVMWKPYHKRRFFNGQLASAGRCPLISWQKNHGSPLWWLSKLSCFFIKNKCFLDSLSLILLLVRNWVTKREISYHLSFSPHSFLLLFVRQYKCISNQILILYINTLI